LYSLKAVSIKEPVMTRKTIVSLIAAAILIAAVFGNCGKKESQVMEAKWEFMPEYAQYGSAVGEFGFSLLKGLQDAEQGENIFISPLSIQFALALCMNGAEGGTLEAMQKTLGLLGMTGEYLDAAAKFLLGAKAAGVQIDIANSLWHSQEVKLLKSFIQKNNAYNAEIRGLDFVSPKAVSIVNDWVNTKTRKMIPSILNEIDKDTVLIAVNAIYFNGEWQDAFEKANSAEKPFTLDSGEKEDVTLMNRSGNYRYMQDDTLQVVALPYGNGRYSMCVLLPKQGTKLADLLQGMEWERCKALLGSLRPRDGEVSIPVFNTSFGTVDLTEDLTALGMGIAFDQGEADFSGMIEKKAGYENLYISAVLHKAGIKVNEKGTEAAAVTAVPITRTALVLDPPEPFTFIADRPFAYIIMDNAASVPLFMGKLEKPE
jgi:serpin B